MPSHPDRDKPVKENADQNLVQKVQALQERVRKMGVVSDGLDDKAFMDEGWSEQSNDPEDRDVEALRASTSIGLNSSSSILNNQVIDGLRPRNATKS